MLRIVPATVAEIEADPAFDALAAEYAAECAIEGLPPPRAKWETYRGLEAGGHLRVIAARLSGDLIGFIAVLGSPLPHYSTTVAVSESFFVASAHRAGTGAGIHLLRAAERVAADIGSPGLLVSAPYGGRLFEILPRLGYVETNRVFFRRVEPALPAVVDERPRRIEPMSPAAIDKVRLLEAANLARPQVAIETEHLFHAGMYARTIALPAGTLLTGALVKVDTVLIVAGDALVFLEGGTVQLRQYSVLQAAAHRKQAFLAQTDVFLTMVFPTAASDVATVEAEFTDEVERLQSRWAGNRVRGG